MFNAILRLVLVSLAVTFVIAGFIGVARTISRQSPQTTHHPWSERTTWIVRAPADPCAEGGRDRGDDILILPVHRRPDAWYARCPGEPTLETVLANAPHADWLIDVEAGAGEDLDNFVDIASRIAGKRIGIRAASQRAARALRRKAPQWAYAADDASLVRLHLFTSMFLDVVVEFWPDFVIATPRGAGRLPAAERAELARRGKPLLWDGGTDHAAAPFAVIGSVSRP